MKAVGMSPIEFMEKGRESELALEIRCYGHKIVNVNGKLISNTDDIRARYFEKVKIWEKGDKLLKEHGKPIFCFHSKYHEEQTANPLKTVDYQHYCHRCGKFWGEMWSY